VHNRRYLLQEIAMEIFSNDGRNYLLVFPRKCRNKIYERLIALTPDLNDNAQQSIAGQRRSINIEQNTGILNALIGEKSVVQRWERGELTNFQYLMFLNTLAGRSYNDLMQYPVFPWILADYDSDELDLNSPLTFRDLSKPMGAQNSERLKQFEKRYQEWEDPTSETPPYHYGTHYSSAMIVASYLLRLEPFTQIFLRLQGGHFDLADRLFHSIKDNWLSASRNNMADVKELIPEFYYLPEFLINSNKFDLGKKQSGVVLDDVQLPPWAKNDAHEFIRVHRMALESDYVSAHLNEWIDLIFGYKQQGQAAIDSMNAFHHLFYEGAVNIDEIDDPLRRNAIIGFINNFGQIPKQLFKKPHPVKKLNSQFIYGIASNLLSSGLTNTAANIVNVVASNALTNQEIQQHQQQQQLPIQQQQQQSQQPVQLVFIHFLKSLKPSLQPVRELKSQIGQIITLEKGQLLVVEQNKYLIPPTYQRYIAWGFADESIKIGNADYEKSYITYENVQEGGALFCCCAPNSRTIITAGTSTTVNVWDLSKFKYKRLKLKARLYGHEDTVTCMAISNSYHMLVTGSRDRTCIIWDINEWTFVRQLDNHYGAISCIAINETTVNKSKFIIYLIIFL
jgi:WD repeat and FYVE domain-containing protein 3